MVGSHRFETYHKPPLWENTFFFLSGFTYLTLDVMLVLLFLDLSALGSNC